ncbi:MAG: peptidoglycan DL-endopeptidase CwlO [Pseudonocardiales bacterium]|nr:peptidoglycan DL-endopeptidase CwlO [Pseudonocardiales bacterium]
MAIRPARTSKHVSLGIAAAALGVATLLAPAAHGAPSTPATPSASSAPSTTSLASVQKQLADLNLKNSQVVEAYDQAQVTVGARQAAARTAQASAVSAAASYARAQKVLSATIAAEYEAGAFSATGALLSSDSGQSYLNSINTISTLSTHTAQVVQSAVRAKAVAERAEAGATHALAAAVTARDAANKQRLVVQAEVAKLKSLVASLTAAQRAAYNKATNPALTPSAVSAKLSTPAPPTQYPVPPASSRAAIAVRFALAQVGKPYVWGASGPNAYDCSGLTMASWAAAGVSLPHSSREQYNYGTHVSVSALQPGDLVFMYSPISHVTIYIGGGMLVSAPQTGQDVSVVSLSSFMNVYAGATRLG